MAMSAQQAYIEIKDHIGKSGRPYSNWYSGIASDPEARLFDQHHVSRKFGWWTYRQCYNANDAKTVEAWLLKLGCNGNPIGGDEKAIHTYAYLKAFGTEP
jgi:hypothetical protein